MPVYNFKFDIEEGIISSTLEGGAKNSDAKLDALMKIMQERDERMEERLVGISKDVEAMRHILQSVLDKLILLDGPMAGAAGRMPLSQPVPISALPSAPANAPVDQQREMVGENLYPLLATALANAPLDQQRKMLRENLYPLVEQLGPKAAGKVTGMLLEMDQPEVLHLLESPEALKAKVSEAMEAMDIEIVMAQEWSVEVRGCEGSQSCRWRSCFCHDGAYRLRY